MSTSTVEEKKEVIRFYRRLLRKARPSIKEGDAKRIKKAFTLSLDRHNNVRRESGELYIFHPLTVAQICVEEIGLGPTSIIAALIHDLVEDTDIELHDIERHFGKKVARIADGLTKVRGAFERGSSAQAENFRKMIFTLSEDVRVILIKLADRLHNMRTLKSMPRNKQLKIASETIYFYAPMAHRLGLNAIKTELEDLHLRFTNKSAYDKIVSSIADTKISRNRFVRHFIQPIKEGMDKMRVPYVIKSRPKSVYSIWNKMCKQNIPFEKVYDLFAVRIIIDVPADKEKASIWQSYSVVTENYTPNPDRLRDWVSVSKANGYESLHTTVMAKNGQWVEVQIRTKRMDEIAEKGYAAHWKYKNNLGFQESNLEKWLVHVRESLERQDLSALEFVDHFKANFFDEEIFVFTPRGELKNLPHGATALDFAFEIHSDVGAQCVGTKVNQKLKPLNYKLKNGDQVEALTSSKQKPSKDWLNFVVTSKAKSRIKDSLRSHKKTIAEQGKEILSRKFKNTRIDLSSSFIEKIKDYFKAPSLFDLYYEIGAGIITLKDLKQINDISSGSKTKTEEKQLPKKNLVQKKSYDEDAILIGDDMEVTDYTLSKCCVPIPGDDIFGFVTVGEGIKVHRTTCPNASELLARHGNRIIKAKWTSQQKIAFLTGLKIIGVDRVGLINDLSSIISQDLKVNMRSLSFNTEGGIFTGEIMLYVNNTQHLDQLTNKLQSVDSVETVHRIDFQHQYVVK